MNFRRKLIRTKGRLERAIDHLLYLFSGDSVLAKVDGLSAEFTVPTLGNYRRAKHLSNERPQISFLLSEVGEEDIFWDVGSCTGSYTCFVGQVAAQTAAFDPHPGNAAVLRENVASNGLEDRVTVREAALSDRSGTGTLHVDSVETASGHHSLIDRGLDDTIDIEVVKGDDLNEYPRPDVVKVDVEGSERAVIAGMSDTLKTHCRLVLVEVHPEADQGSVEEALVNLGFTLKSGWGGSDHTFLVARRTP